MSKEEIILFSELFKGGEYKMSDYSGIYSTTETETTTTTTTDSTDSTDDTDTLGQEAFLELLVTQLENQDPLDPMDGTEYVSQLAQFSSLEQMSNLNDTMSTYVEMQGVYEGSSLIGKTVEAEVDDETVSGEVTSISYEDDTTYAYLDDEQQVEVENITTVYSDA